jgi:hypothetical protein
MPRSYTANLDDGTTFTLNGIPDDATEAQVHTEIERQVAMQRTPAARQAQPAPTAPAAPPSFARSAAESIRRGETRVEQDLSRVGQALTAPTSMADTPMASLLGPMGRLGGAIMAPGFTGALNAARVGSEALSRWRGGTPEAVERAGRTGELAVGAAAAAPLAAKAFQEIATRLSPKLRAAAEDVIRQEKFIPALQKWSTSFSPKARQQFGLLDKGVDITRTGKGSFRSWGGPATADEIATGNEVRAAAKELKGAGRLALDEFREETGLTTKAIKRMLGHAIHIGGGALLGHHAMGGATGIVTGGMAGEGVMMLGRAASDLVFANPVTQGIAKALVGMAPDSPGYVKLASILVAHLAEGSPSESKMAPRSTPPSSLSGPQQPPPATLQAPAMHRVDDNFPGLP